MHICLVMGGAVGRAPRLDMDGIKLLNGQLGMDNKNFIKKCSIRITLQYDLNRQGSYMKHRFEQSRTLDSFEIKSDDTVTEHA